MDSQNGSLYSFSIIKVTSFLSFKGVTSSVSNVFALSLNTFWENIYLFVISYIRVNRIYIQTYISTKVIINIFNNTTTHIGDLLGEGEDRGFQVRQYRRSPHI